MATNRSIHSGFIHLALAGVLISAAGLSAQSTAVTFKGTATVKSPAKSASVPVTIHIDRFVSDAERDKLLRDALVRTRDQHYYVPLHHQMRPWAMKKNVSITYSPDDRPQARFATMK